ncbi:MAG: sigma-54-dependent Fis family transcriptional regulator [Enhydrobacter sp.]|jgi:sigma-54 dependent transcriptional regulator, acetoin dehydrogenase operon transcriptional activator AcoR|nr:MAG: sigma-54-dependent Fis family transcriptional regulator [Enhydrobacter sp.]
MKDIPLAQLCSKDYIRTVGRVWERFVTDRPVDDAVVRDVVIESWRRCRQNGVDPATRSAPLRVNGADVDRFQLRHAQFYAAVRACVPPIVPYLKGSRIILITSAPDGTLLSVDGDPHLTDRLAADHIVPGAAWHEYSSGTNAVGTALALGRPLHIHAEEHFCEVAKPWSCTAAVVRDPFDRRIVGVVDITGPPDTVNAQTWPFVMSLVGQLQGHLQKQALAKRARLIELFEAAIGGRETAAVLLDAQGRVIARTVQAPSALREHGLSRTQAMGELVATPHGSVEPKWLASLAPGIREEWLSPLKEDGQCVGAILHLPTTSRRQGSTSHRLKALPPLAPAFQRLLQTSPSLDSMLRQAERFASASTPLLLQGETGTGKDMLARAVHAAGPFHAGPFVPVNCAALPRDILASELFGHAEGAFTGARRGGARGRFEQANGGVLFLDEIGDMPADLQPYLLRVLEEGAVWRLGEAAPRKIAMRVIAATNRPLAKDVGAGRFRADLYHRLNVAGLTVPPLRERPGDIPPLVGHLLRDIAGAAPPVQIAPEVMDVFLHYGWPGNVRELRNCLERMVPLATDPILGLELLPTAILEDESPCGLPLASTIRGAERQMVLAAIRREGGNLSRAARSLGIARTTLYRHIRRCGTD